MERQRIQRHPDISIRTTNRQKPNYSSLKAYRRRYLVFESYFRGNDSERNSCKSYGIHVNTKWQPSHTESCEYESDKSYGIHYSCEYWQPSHTEFDSDKSYGIHVNTRAKATPWPSPSILRLRTGEISRQLVTAGLSESMSGRVGTKCSGIIWKLFEIVPKQLNMKIFWRLLSLKNVQFSSNFSWILIISSQ